MSAIASCSHVMAAGKHKRMKWSLNAKRHAGYLGRRSRTRRAGPSSAVVGSGLRNRLDCCSQRHLPRPSAAHRAPERVCFAALAGNSSCADRRRPERRKPLPTRPPAPSCGVPDNTAVPHSFARLPIVNLRSDDVRSARPAMSAAISCPGRMCPACMASIGAIVISAQAATISSNTAAVAFFAILP